MRKVLLALALMLVFAVPSNADWTGLAGDQLVSYFPGTTGDNTAASNRIVAAPNGVLYCAWIQGRSISVPNEVFFSKSTDNGRTWSGTPADQRINAADGEGAGNYLDRGIGLAVNGLGHIFVVWAESLTNAGYEIMFVRSTDGGATWINSGADFPISLPGGPRATLPKIATDNNNNLHAVWQQRDGNDISEIHYGFSSDGGDTWTSQIADRIISFPDGNGASYSEITTDADNDVYVTWREVSDPDANMAIHIGIKLAAQSQFSSETVDRPVGQPHAGVDVSSIAVTPNGSIHVVWEARNTVGGSSKGAIYYSRSSDGGNTWSGLITEQFIDYDAFDDSSCTDPAIVATSQGNLAVVYTNWSAEISDNFHRPRVSFSTDGGVIWSGTSAAEVVSFYDASDNRSGYGPDICISTGDTLHVIWHEDCADIGGSSGYYEVMYSRGDVLAVAAPNPGNISGLVRETDNTTPIADVLVETFDIFNTLWATDTTDALGAYQATVPPGTYREHFTKESYDAVDLSGIVVVSDSTTTVAVTMSQITGCIYVPGDINGNNFANGIDVTYGVAYFKGGNPPPDTCFDCPAAGQNLLATGDVNGNCAFNGIDITFFVAYLKGIQPSIRWCETCPPATLRD
jgi:hypothetical protein